MLEMCKVSDFVSKPFFLVYARFVIFFMISTPYPPSPFPFFTYLLYSSHIY